MHENIIKMFERAGGYVSPAFGREGNRILSGDDTIEEFVKLIAKECADLCINEYRTMDGWGLTSADVRCHKLICDVFGLQANTTKYI